MKYVFSFVVISLLVLCLALETNSTASRPRRPPIKPKNHPTNDRNDQDTNGVNDFSSLNLNDNSKRPRDSFESNDGGSSGGDQLNKGDNLSSRDKSAGNKRNRLSNAFDRKMQTQHIENKRLLFSRIVKKRPLAKTANLNMNTQYVKIENNFENTPLSNKEIFEALQQYRFEDSVITGYDKPVNQGPLNVEMNIGGNQRTFTLRKANLGSDQVYVGTTNDNYASGTKAGKNYEQIATDLESTNGMKLNEATKKNLIKQRAALILDAIGSYDQKVWEKEYMKDTNGQPILDSNNKPIRVMGDQQIRSGVELIVISQVAESAPPNEAYYHKLVNIVKNQDDVTDKVEKSGRVPGADKYARAAINLVKEGYLTFSDLFDKSKGLYVPAQKKGTQKTRDLMLNSFKNVFLHEHMTVFDVLNGMSASSGVESGYESES